MTASLHELSLADVGALIRSKQVSPVEVTEQALARIEQLNPRLNAFWTVTADLAREQARAAETEIAKGEYRGPLHGVPIGFKDLIYTRGVRTTCGSKIMADFVPDADATVVEKLRQAGAVLIGKAALHEFAYGITNDNPHFGPTRNPWDPARVPGGSSGGSAVAVATGMCHAALGTDTGGSIRIPASFCGVAGLKPTHGRVSLSNVYPLGPTLDHVGPMARTVVDVGLVYQVIAGYDPEDEFSVDRPLDEIRLSKSLGQSRAHERAGPEGIGNREQGTGGRSQNQSRARERAGQTGAIKIGIPENYFFDCVQPQVETLVRKATSVLEHLGAVLIPVRIERMDELTQVSIASLYAEAYVTHKNHLETRPNDLSEQVRKQIEQGSSVSLADYFTAQRTRHSLRRQLERLFEQVDVILTPATAHVAFPFGTARVSICGKEEDARPATTRLTRCFNATGHPALVVCCGFTSEGLPAGLQIVGRLWDEATVLHVGYAYEQATDWHTRRPPM